MARLLPALALLLCGCLEVPGVPVVELFPDAIPDAIARWERSEGDLSRPCARELERVYVVVTTPEEAADMCRKPLGAVGGCVDYAGNFWTTAGLTSTVPLAYVTEGVYEEATVGHELGHVLYGCARSTWDREHAGAYWRETR